MKFWLALLCLLALGACRAHPSSISAPPDQIAPARVEVEFTKDRISKRQASGNAGVAGRMVTPDDPVRVASISKMIVALTAMRLVDEGKLELDTDINRYLGYSIRHPEFPDTPLTLRMLLSHHAGITDGIEYYLIPIDAEIGEPMRDPKAWLAGKAPGSWYHYSNLNFPVIAAVMEAASGERFDRLVASRVLAPLKLDACFNWQAGCSEGRWRHAVTLLRANGELARDPQEGEKCPFTPASDGACDISRYRIGHNGASFSPQGGLRISANDLAEIGQLLLRRGAPILSEKSFAEMTTPLWRSGDQAAEGEVTVGAYGLGIMLATDDKGQQWIGHSGSAYALRSGLWVNPKTGEGHARFVTMVAENAPDGNCLVTCP